MPTLIKPKLVWVPDSARRRARDIDSNEDCQVQKIVYRAKSDLSGVVTDIGQNAPFEGEIVRHSANRTTAGKQSKKGFYDIHTYVEGLSRTQASTFTEKLNIAESQKFIASCAEQFSWYNFISIDRYWQMLTDPMVLAAKLAGSRDPAKIAARQMLEQAAQPLDSLGRRNVNRNLLLLLRAGVWLQDRDTYLSSNVSPAATQHLAWADRMLRDHGQLVKLICTRLSTTDNFENVWHQISPLVSQLQIKPWTFFKHYFSFISRLDLPWSVEPDINWRLINALMLEGASSDLRETARLADYAQTHSDHQAALERLISRIEWLETLELPRGYGGNIIEPGLREQLVICLARLKHRLRTDASHPTDEDARDERISARKLDSDRLRWELRYRALPGQSDCQMWHGAIR